MLKNRSARAPCTAGPGARALYLGSSSKKQVSCTAEALVVRNELGQTLRYPLVRVDRVVSSTQVDWRGSALALCLQHGIGISWVNARGDALGTCYPKHRKPVALATALELWLESPGGLEQYQHWLRSRRMDVLVRWGKAATPRINPTQWENTKREWVYQREFDAHLPQALHGHLMCYISIQLAKQGLAPSWWDADAQAVDLDADLCELLWAEMNLGTGALADTTQSDAETVALFDRWVVSNGAALVVHLSSLHRTAMKATRE